MGLLGGEERELRDRGAGTEGKGMCEGRDQASFLFYPLASAFLQPFLLPWIISLRSSKGHGNLECVHGGYSQ